MYPSLIISQSEKILNILWAFGLIASDKSFDIGPSPYQIFAHDLNIIVLVDLSPFDFLGQELIDKFFKRVGACRQLCCRPFFELQKQIFD